MPSAHARLITAAAMSAALALPAAASAATLTAATSCAASGNAMPVAGSGFTPGTSVTLTSNAGSDSVTTDTTGAFTTTVTAPPVSDFSAHTLTLTATDTANPSLAASTQFSVVKGPFETNFPVDGRPRQTVLWQFAGFVSGKPIYAHLRFHGRTRANYRFGRAGGPCGTLRAHAKRLPTAPHYGNWSIQFDQVATYNRYTKPRRVLGVTIYRTFH